MSCANMRLFFFNLPFILGWGRYSDFTGCVWTRWYCKVLCVHVCVSVHIHQGRHAVQQLWKIEPSIPHLTIYNLIQMVCAKISKWFGPCVHRQKVSVRRVEVVDGHVASVTVMQ